VPGKATCRAAFRWRSNTSTPHRNELAKWARPARLLAPDGNIMAIQGLELAKACAKAADDIQAEKIRLWDLRGLSNLTDFMVVCSGSSMPHLRAILRDVRGHVDDEHGAKPVNAEGNADTKWVVLDYIDVMVHVMHEELRDFYGLEDLWADAKEVDWKA
jgi:ribosome-associated protein